MTAAGPGDPAGPTGAGPRRPAEPPPGAAASGLQRERTALAWERTGLTFFVVGALLLRVGGEPYHHPRHIPGALSILVGGALVAGAARHGGRGATGPRARRRRRVLLRLVGAAAVGVSAAALAVLLLGG